MRILNLQGPSFIKAFRKAGHDVLGIGHGQGCDVRIDRFTTLGTLQDILHSRDFVPDLIFWFDNGSMPEVHGFWHLPSVLIGFSVDQYCNPWHVPFSTCFDHFFVAQKDYLHLFENDQYIRSCEWLPLFCDPLRCTDLQQERDIPVSFVGTLKGRFNSKRKPFLDAFRETMPLVCFSGNFTPIYQRSSIVLNQSAVGELNYRIFEAMACGAVCLTEETSNGLLDLFVPGKDTLLYKRGDAHDAARVAREALQNPNLEDIALTGMEKVLGKHSVEIRAQRILLRAEQLARKGALMQRKKRMQLIEREMRNACAFLATDSELPVPPIWRLFFLKLSGQ